MTAFMQILNKISQTPEIPLKATVAFVHFIGLCIFKGHWPLFGLWFKRPWKKMSTIANKLPAYKFWTKPVNKKQSCGMFYF